MSVELRWLNVEHTILFYDVRGVWTWADMYAAVVRAHNIMDTLDHTVHSIVDMSAAGRMGDNPLTHGRRLGAATHPRAGLSIFIQAPAFMRVLFGTLGRLNPQLKYRIQFASTREEALAVIEEAQAVESRVLA